MLWHNVVLEQDKHIVATFYNISFIESSYGASVRYDHEVSNFLPSVRTAFSILER